MIEDAEIEVMLPCVNPNISDALAEISDMMYRSVQLNFDLGGRPEPWQALRNGVTETPLVGSGRLRRSIYKESDADTATVAVPNTVRYAAIHNFGGVINHPGSNKRQVFRIGDKWIATNHTEPHAIPIPIRKYMMFQEQDLIQYRNMVSGAIITNDAGQSSAL